MVKDGLEYGPGILYDQMEEVGLHTCYRCAALLSACDQQLELCLASLQRKQQACKKEKIAQCEVQVSKSKCDQSGFCSMCEQQLLESLLPAKVNNLILGQLKRLTTQDVLQLSRS